MNSNAWQPMPLGVVFSIGNGGRKSEVEAVRPTKQCGPQGTTKISAKSEITV